MVLDKKGFAGDFIILSATLFVVAIGLFAVFGAFNDSYQKMIDNPVINSSNNTVTTLEAGQDTLLKFDYLFLAVFIGLMFGVFITGWFIGGRPIFMFLYFIVITIIVILSVLFANFWEDITVMSVFAGDVASFPITNHIIVNLPVYIGIIGLLGVVAMFVRPYSEE